jgi:PhnB protein
MGKEYRLRLVRCYSVPMSKAASPIPPGFTTLTVHLAVNGAAAYIDFLKKAFNAVEISRSPGPGGKLMHAQVRIGDAMLMFADDFGAEFGMPPLAQGRMPFHLHIYVPDADATWKQAVAAGCEVTMPISDQFWGDRYGHVKDPFGITWAIATRKEELTPQEIQERQAKAFSSGHP